VGRSYLAPAPVGLPNPSSDVDASRLMKNGKQKPDQLSACNKINPRGHAEFLPGLAFRA
jgi:hypothetical protein